MQHVCPFLGRHSLTIVGLFLSHFQGKQVLVDGVGRSPETEVELQPTEARKYLDDPSKLLEAGLPLMDALQK